MQTTAGLDGHTYTLTAQTGADFAFIDALDEHHAVAVQQITRRAKPIGGYTASGAVLAVNSKNPEALEAKSARQFLRAVRELLRLGLGEDALHSHIGLDTANPQTQQQIAALLKQLQLVLQLGTLAVCKPEGVGKKVDAAHSNTPCSEKAIVAQASALLRRARAGIAFAAACDNDHGFQFWQGYASAAADLLDGKSARMAARDAVLADEPQTRHEAAGAALPESTKDLTMAQVRQILTAQRAEVATDAVSHADVCAGEVLKHDMVAGIDGDDEHAPARVHVGDGTGAHGCCSAMDEKAIVVQGGAA